MTLIPPERFLLPHIWFSLLSFSLFSKLMSSVRLRRWIISTVEISVLSTMYWEKRSLSFCKSFSVHLFSLMNCRNSAILVSLSFLLAWEILKRWLWLQDLAWLPLVLFKLLCILNTLSYLKVRTLFLQFNFSREPNLPNNKCSRFLLEILFM